MRQQFPIHDLVIEPLTSTPGQDLQRLIALQDGDYLLRRFGLAEAIHARAGAAPVLHLRQAADELWMLIEGQVLFLWHDQRPGSPSHDVVFRVTCSQPTRLLAPFGVAFGFQVLSPEARLLRLATHAEGEHEGDHELPWIT